MGFGEKKRVMGIYVDFKMGRNECLLCDSNLILYKSVLGVFFIFKRRYFY